MSSDILFDNIVITEDEMHAIEWSKKTFDLKRKQIDSQAVSFVKFSIGLIIIFHISKHLRYTHKEYVLGTNVEKNELQTGLLSLILHLLYDTGLNLCHISVETSAGRFSSGGIDFTFNMSWL